MIALAAVAAAGLLALSAPPSIPATAEDLTVEAGSVTYRADTGRYQLEGGVVLRRGVVTLRARSASYDPSTGEVDAVGDVLLTDATRAVAADGLRAVMDGGFKTEHVVAFLKEGPVAMGDATGAEDARRRGRNRATFTGATLEGERSGHLRLGDARLTLCDCGGGAPSWELRARRAEVEPGHHATLSWPVLYVTPRFLFVKRPVPVLILPWIFLPLGERQSGLLFPSVASTGATGFGVALPVFVTLGRSADATLTPEYLFGRARADVADGQPAVRGWGLRLELRWAPAEDAAGEIELHGIDDQDREPGGAGGGRLGIVGTHGQRLGASGRLRADVALASDPVWFRDATGDLLLRSAYYRRSALLASFAGDALVVEGGAAYHQPLTPSGWYPDATGARPGYGTFGADLPTFHRWPGLAATLLPEALGPVQVSGRLGLSRYATVNGDTGATFTAGDPGATRGFVTTSREGVSRLDARAELAAPLRLGSALTVTPYARGAALGYRFDTGRSPAVVAWGVGGAALSSEVSRRYGAVLHRIVPRLELRAGTRAFGSEDGALPLRAYDVWDRVGDDVQRGPVSVAEPAGQPAGSLTAASDGTFRQLRASVESRLDGPGGSLRLQLGQDVDLVGGVAGETFFSAAAHRGPVTAEVSGRVLAFQGRAVAAPAPRFPSWLDHFTELHGAITAADRRGDLVRAGLVAVGPGASGQLMAGVDALFDLRPAAIDASAQGSAGFRGVLGGATLGYDALFTVRPIEVARCSGAGTRRVDAGQVQQHAGSVTWNSPCHCFLARLVVRVNDCGETSYSAAVDLSRLGERAAVR
ncbi:OstA family protein [Anaeromyxobacter dehalogenans 2CP-1]|uniref:OstA family protein n=1 Tax=Anaeromyxobacter dehalogenans (strain ATCC BAA-258 / DSM 21875 / 2CP-1) TaxID=455488 RepID=B8JDI4_ANAD2|nr:LPS-assembly protein LptD [Anaeromyxobacter dehalogenans]ACL66033.1 OstA family protein [Anaeromyxobacter dehalogenans 2CP-1]